MGLCQARTVLRLPNGRGDEVVRCGQLAEQGEFCYYHSKMRDGLIAPELNLNPRIDSIPTRVYSDNRLLWKGDSEANKGSEGTEDNQDKEKDIG